MVSMEQENSPFIFIANNLGVDFTNTELIFYGETVDLLTDNNALSQWADKAGLPIDSQSEHLRLITALELRAALKKSFIAIVDDKKIPDGSLAKINQHLPNYSTQQVLQLENNNYVLQPKYKKLTFSNFLGCVAHESASLLSSSQSKKLKRCSNPECILLFVDTSRGQKRRWCSMDLCGNRAKAAKHYRKTKS